jgi:hypothetical protein
MEPDNKNDPADTSLKEDLSTDATFGPSKFSWDTSFKGTMSRDFFVSSFFPQTNLTVLNNRGVIRIRNRLLGDEYTGELIRISCVRQFFQT